MDVVDRHFELPYTQPSSSFTYIFTVVSSFCTHFGLVSPFYIACEFSFSVSNFLEHVCQSRYLPCVFGLPGTVQSSQPALAASSNPLDLVLIHTCLKSINVVSVTVSGEPPQLRD